MKVVCRADGLVPLRFAIFPLHLSKVLRLPRKSDARSYKVLHLSRKIISANLKIWCSKMQPVSGNQRPNLLTALMNMSLVLRLPRDMHLCRSCSNVPRLPSFLEMLQDPHVLTFCSLLTRSTIPCPCHAKAHLNVQKWSEPLVFLTFWLRNVLLATTVCTFPKVVRTWCVLTSKCASRHNGVHFFDIATSKSDPELVYFVHFELEMRFAPQRRALFRHLYFQKRPENHVFCTFWLWNVLRATTACNFSSLIWPAGSAPAALASLLFEALEPQIIWKTQCFATFLPFRAPASSFFWPFLFSDLLSSALLFSILLLHLCFSSVHIVGSLTSKPPSMIFVYFCGTYSKMVKIIDP